MRDAGGKHRWPIPEGVTGRAVFSDDGEYRYVLWREWEPIAKEEDEERPGYIAFVGLNPSTADPDLDDPTVRRCWKWAREWGYSGMAMLNLYAYRATSPAALRLVADPEGPDNDAHIRAVSADAERVYGAWGAIGSYSDNDRGRRARDVTRLLDREVYALALTQKGDPRHPLYLPNDVTPVLWSPVGRERFSRRSAA